MKFANYKVTNLAGNIVFESETSAEAFIAGVAFQHFNVPAKHLAKVSRVGYDMYLKGDYVSLGHLADFVSKRYRSLENKTIRELLDDFYNNMDLGGY